MKTYKAEFADDEIEVFSYCSNDDEALREAFSMESEHGTLFKMKTMSITYNLYTIIDGMKIYKRYAENKLLINTMMQMKGA